MKVRRKIKRSTKQYIMVAFICITVIGSAAVITSVMITGQIKSRYAALLSEAEEELEKNKKTIYVAVNDIASGDYITEDNISARTILANQPMETYITVDDIGKVALIGIPEGTQIIKGMLTEHSVSSNLREIEYSVINVSGNIADNDSVDIRILYPNGESYVILSKKAIRGYTAGSVICYLWLDEEELLRMSAAIVDAGLYTGTSLITTKYIEPSIQAASVVTYTPNLSILSLIENDPNIVERMSQKLNKDVRKALENRLASSLNMNVSEIAWSVNNDTFRKSDMAEEEDNTVINDPAGNTSDAGTKEPTSQGELGYNTGNPDDYLFYAEEEEAREKVIEYGD